MAVSFSQFSRKQREKYETGELGNAIRFWRSQLTPPPPPLPILSLSNITTRKPLTFYQNESITFKIGSDLRKQVQGVCQRHRATPFHFYVAVLRALLLRYSTDSEDIAIGIADADRTPETTDVLGPFVNFFPLRLRANGSERFEEVLQDVRTRHYTAMAHSVLPFQVLLNEYVIHVVGVLIAPRLTSIQGSTYRDPRTIRQSFNAASTIARVRARRCHGEASQTFIFWGSK